MAILNLLMRPGGGSFDYLSVIFNFKVLFLILFSRLIAENRFIPILP